MILKLGKLDCFVNFSKQSSSKNNCLLTNMFKLATIILVLVVVMVCLCESRKKIGVDIFEKCGRIIDMKVGSLYSLMLDSHSSFYASIRTGTDSCVAFLRRNQGFSIFYKFTHFNVTADGKKMNFTISTSEKTDLYSNVKTSKEYNYKKPWTSRRSSVKVLETVIRVNVTWPRNELTPQLFHMVVEFRISTANQPLWMIVIISIASFCLLCIVGGLFLFLCVQFRVRRPRGQRTMTMYDTSNFGATTPHSPSPAVSRLPPSGFAPSGGVVLPLYTPSANTMPPVYTPSSIAPSIEAPPKYEALPTGQNTIPQNLLSPQFQNLSRSTPTNATTSTPPTTQIIRRHSSSHPSSTEPRLPANGQTSAANLLTATTHGHESTDPTFASAQMPKTSSIRVHETSTAHLHGNSEIPLDGSSAADPNDPRFNSAIDPLDKTQSALTEAQPTLHEAQSTLPESSKVDSRTTMSVGESVPPEPSNT